MDVEKLYAEVSTYLSETDVVSDGDRIISNYERAVSILVRLQEIKNEISLEELYGRAPTTLKKFRTTILEDTIQTFQDVCRFESRKISARQLESQLDKER